mmetsp:Transcript_5612/g.13701  ORF Transcript_5612/g.13701 Transcript_5612/m.13701 type:complete len:164 (+) Transcript_5612:2916-3407(+)
MRRGTLGFPDDRMTGSPWYPCTRSTVLPAPGMEVSDRKIGTDSFFTRLVLRAFSSAVADGDLKVNSGLDAAERDSVDTMTSPPRRKPQRVSQCSREFVDSGIKKTEDDSSGRIIDFSRQELDIDEGSDSDNAGVLAAEDGPRESREVGDRSERLPMQRFPLLL